jgi:uncharacterized protein (TIRG00374 family)
VNRRWRVLLVIPVLAAAIALIIWHGPDWHVVHDAFTVVRWEWVVAAIGFNLLSVVLRSVAWDTAIKQSLAPPRPGFPLVFSAFSVGLFANAVLPGRVGELARVAVLRRRLPGRRGVGATLIGSVVAHRIFDLFPATVLVVWVLFTAKIPGWAIKAIPIVLAVGALLLLAVIYNARRQHRDLEGLSTIRSLIARGREGLAVMRSPVAAATAASFQFGGWVCQLFAVWSTMRAFHIYHHLPAAGLVLVLMNVATIVPVWPGNVGLVQAVIASPLLQYNVDYGRGIAFGIGLQAIEASVGIGVGLIFLAREGLSVAMLRVMPSAAQMELPEGEEAGADAGRSRARVPG